MTREEVIPMLCVACGVSPASADINVTALYSIVDKLIAAEREACAKLCEEIAKRNETEGDFDWVPGNLECAAAIRARGET